MRILILGGTRFLGKHAAAIALQRGHAVTLFNRGKSGSATDPRAVAITGDRHADIERLAAGEWDAVIDTSAYHPESVRIAARTLRARTESYLVVSSVSVYSLATPLIDHDSALLPALSTQEVDAIDPGSPVIPKLYGPLKTLCETAASEAYGPGKTLIVRPGLIVGPDDPTDRFTYWPLRADTGGEILAPDAPDHIVQFIDVRDLAAWMIHALEARLHGAFNVTGPRATTTMGQVLDAARRATSQPSSVVWIDEDFLLAHEVGPWMELPLWIPRNDSMSAGIANVSIDRALAAGLAFRPLEDTVADTLAWARTYRDPATLGAGMKAERERELLAQWRERAP